MFPVVYSARRLTQTFGVCRMQFDSLQAQSHFELAYAGFTHTGEAAGLYASWVGVTGCICMAWHDFVALTPWLEALADLRRRHPQWPSVEIELRVVTGAVMSYSGHRPDLRAWIVHAQHLIDSTANDVLRIQLATYVVLALIWVGESGQAARLVESLDSVSKAVGNLPLTKAWWEIALMLSYWHRLMPRTALSKLDTALRLRRL